MSLFNAHGEVVDRHEFAFSRISVSWQNITLSRSGRPLASYRLLTNI